jgi:hypothetical protein
MASANSQSPKDSKENVLSSVVEPIRSFFNNPQRSVSPAPSERSPGHSSKSRMRKLLGKFTSTSHSQSTLSLPQTSSTENPGRKTPLGKYRIFSMYILNGNPIVDSSTVAAADGSPPNRPLVTMGSSQYLDHRTPPASFGSHALATPPVVESE